MLRGNPVRALGAAPAWTVTQVRNYLKSGHSKAQETIDNAITLGILSESKDQWKRHTVNWDRYFEQFPQEDL